VFVQAREPPDTECRPSCIASVWPQWQMDATGLGRLSASDFALLYVCCIAFVKALPLHSIGWRKACGGMGSDWRKLGGLQSVARAHHRGCYVNVCGCYMLHRRGTCGCYSAKHLRACFRTASLGEESRPHPCLRAGLRIPHSLVLSMARFRLSSHNLGVELGRHQGVVWFARGCKRCAALGMHDLPVNDEAHLSFRVQLPLWLGGSVDLHNCHLQDLMCCRDVQGVALFVHKCMKIADAAPVAAARQQPR
jgi:hypothetical protein